jgi:hypothetical protein
VAADAVLSPAACDGVVTLAMILAGSCAAAVIQKLAISRELYRALYRCPVSSWHLQMNIGISTVFSELFAFLLTF